MAFKNPFKSFSYLALSNLVTIPVTALTTVLLARYLEPVHLGIFLAGEAFVEMFSFFFTMGFKNSVLKLASEESDFKLGLRKALGAAIILRLIIVVPIAVLIFLSAKYFNQDPIIIKVITAFIVVEICRSFTNIFGIIRKALEQFKLVAGINIVDKLLKLLVIFIAFNHLGGLEEYLYAIAIVALLKFMISLVSTFNLCRPKFAYKAIMPMLKESFLYGIHDYLEEAQNKIDKLMLNYILGPSAVAFYSIPSKLNRLIRALPTSIKQIFLPQFYRSINNAKEIKKVLTKLIKLLLLVALPLATGIYFFAEPLLSFLFDAKYKPAIELAPNFAFIALIWFANLPANLWLAAKTKHKERNFIQVLSIASNIGLNFWMIPRFGIIGAIWATIIAGLVKLLCSILICCFGSRK